MHSQSTGRLAAGLAVTIAIAAAALLGSAPARASVQLQPSSSPLLGSTFQGADGNQTPANPTTKLDWEDFKHDPDLKTMVDPSNPDREFGGGSSEDSPDNWSFSDPADSTPAKANFRVAWDLFKSDPGRFLQLGFRRAANGGNAFLAFEFNQDPKMWTNSKGTSIPCRTTGDLLITYNVANSDATEIYLTVQQWTSSTTDPTSGCARTGTLSELPSSALTDGVNVQGAVNNATSNALSPELPSPPSGLPNNETGAIPSEMEAGLTCGSASDWICGGLFGEAAINLPSVFSQYQDNPCFSFGSVWAHGRSSISQSSALQDYVEPTAIAIRSCTASGFKFNDLNANGSWDKPDEPAVPGWKVWLDKNKDGNVDSGETATTDSSGEYVFTGLSAGTWTIKELPASQQAGDLKNLDTCSYPSNCSDGYSVTIDSDNLTSSGNTFGNYARPTITLNKALSPSSDPGRFDLEIKSGQTIIATANSVPEGTNIGTETKTVDPGTYALNEAAAQGTSLDDYSSELACKDQDDKTVQVTNKQVTLTAGQRVTCTYTNTRKTGQIKLTKELKPSSDPGLFNLLIGGDKYATDVGDGGTTGYQTLDTGTWAIDETAGTDTSLADYAAQWACQDDEGEVAITDGKVQLGDGQKISCTVTNTRKTGTITVKKSLSPASDPGLFNLLIGGDKYATDVGDQGSTGKQTLNTGTWTIAETAGTGTSLDDYTSGLACDDGEGAVKVTDGAVQLGDGQNITCTFTNTRKTGTVKLVKSLSPASDPGKFDLQLDGATKAANVGNGGASDTLTVNTGTHTVAEAAGTGTSLGDYTGSASCEAGGAVIASGPVTTLQMPVGSGQAVTCTFTNTRKTGTIIITKNTTDGSLSTFGFTGGALGDFSLASGSSTSFTVPTGTYPVSENPASGYTLSSLVCSDAGDASGSSSVSGSTATVSLQAGETVVCTFTNAPAGGVLPAIVGSARISGSQGCVSGRYAYVRVRGANIQQVSYYVSGRRVSTLTQRNNGRFYELRYPVSRLKAGTGKRVTARVLYLSGASPQATTLRWRIVRCAARVKPKFTG